MANMYLDLETIYSYLIRQPLKFRIVYHFTGAFMLEIKISDSKESRIAAFIHHP